MKYRMNIAGLDRDLPLCKVSDDLYIGAFVMFGDAEITVACARELLARAPKDYDYLLTAEAKSIPLIHEMARQSGAKEYFVARKGLKVYMPRPLHVRHRHQCDEVADVKRIRRRVKADIEGHLFVGEHLLKPFVGYLLDKSPLFEDGVYISLFHRKLLLMLSL